MSYSDIRPSTDFKLETEEYATPDGKIHVRIRKITENQNFVISEETLTVLKDSRQHIDQLVSKKIITEIDKPLIKKAIPCAHFAIWNKSKRTCCNGSKGIGRITE